MSKKIRNTIRYSNEPIKAKVIDDFLPSPSQLVRKDNTVKVTLSLSKSSIDFFKHEAQKNHIPYQKMIRALIDCYVEHYEIRK